MQYLLMCEGQNEKAIIELLIDSNKLIIKRKDLLNREVFFSRQIKNTPNLRIALRTYNNPNIEIWRIGDKQTDKLEIPKEFENIIDKSKIYRFCTKPELEILLIINKDLIKEYNKVKSKTSAKDFAKINIKFNGVKYDASTKFWNNYYSNNTNSLIKDICEYKKIHKNLKNERYLIEIIKNGKNY